MLEFTKSKSELTETVCKKIPQLYWENLNRQTHCPKINLTFQMTSFFIFWVLSTCFEFYGE